MDRSIEAAVQLANKEFIKGFIAGQIILCILFFFLLKVFLFRNSDETSQEIVRRMHQRIAVSKPKPVSAQQRRTIDSLILGKIGYNTSQHPFESCNWLNILIAQFLLTLRTDAEFGLKSVSMLDSILNSAWKPSFLGDISITNFSLGEEYPTLKNARVRFAEPESGMKIHVDFSFDDQLTLGIDTQMLINYPKPGMAALPISIVLSIVKFSGTFVIEFVSKPILPVCQQPLYKSQASETSTSDLGHHTYVSVSVLDDFLLDFDVRSLLGHRTKVKDLPKLTSLISNSLRSVFISEMVFPACKMIKIPNGEELFGDIANAVDENSHDVFLNQENGSETLKSA
ncbi:hypothetical protein BATDEDRAFT_87389 [Batrachochytrium dendrobatidis JAM81]|uniref:Maintenance of mitochondrial morphology protein 1 n=2 Tax=Batrachochytrium dendrobatidis TaxID=109871 RepID=F4NZH8_BATDJ|nr:ERMES complex subunit MMM1 [Batrachochytrium dendrobatidis JAM81]EGF81443.1 hypothetical protein BATDEDRAFT_87389 [Batrachochytrium dendrobatidis JAM81]KAJ8329842.1 ERMES complex subunit mmm1 [Batrachochytrium dendrobatidis]KAK5669909.1 ERMES complex subunit mmm1 [Batrachochytrium dendrobatidis]OAJ38472.1 hypothetical protein BDEG_22394 [Batrachochytrium dendrobatidis JEL423]|eukprot:XP_006678203.1 hypothetical protein BATDEDRAFT_87389 [Batrachochytrium dendrobatidis JAM81]